MYTKQNEGITLVVLVITIIVMLILAGVTVNIVVTGGILGTAEDAKEQVEKTSIIQKALSEIVTKETIKGEPLNDEEKNSILEKYGTVEEDETKGKGVNTTAGFISYNEIIGTEQTNTTTQNETNSTNEINNNTNEV